MSATTNTPLVRVIANGVTLFGIESVEIDAASAFQCGRFRVLKNFVPNDNFSAIDWAQDDAKSIQVSIAIAPNGTNFTTLMIGNVDSHHWNVAGQTIEIEGRDLAAQFIDTRTTDSYRNLTSSEIATKLASLHGLTAVVTPTTTLAGRYYAQDHDRMQAGGFTAAPNQWDLLCLLGRKEGIIPYVVGTVLYFQKQTVPPPLFDVVVSTAQNGAVTCNVDDLTLTRNMTIAKDVRVQVRSWHGKKKAAVIGDVVTQKVRDTERGGVEPSLYVFTVPNLTKAQADAMATQLALELSRHERIISFSLPGVVTITPQVLVNVTGTKTDYDMIYYPESVSTSLSNSQFSTTVRAKFSSPLVVNDSASQQAVASQQRGVSVLNSPAIQNAASQATAAYLLPGGV